MICPWNEQHRQKGDMKWMEWSGMKILNVRVCTANNYNIRRGLLTGFVMYQVRGSFSTCARRRIRLTGRKESNSSGRATISQLWRKLTNASHPSRWTNQKQIKLIKFSGGFSVSKVFRAILVLVLFFYREKGGSIMPCATTTTSNDEMRLFLPSYTFFVKHIL